jgi:hypothetical protein
MPIERAKFRGTVLVEDRRTERFFRELLVRLGFLDNKLFFRTAPSGKGAASAWVRAQYMGEVRLVRQKRHQRIFLIVVLDGDSTGMASKKRDLDIALDSPRHEDERIANLVPTWSIETWLLALLEHSDIDETSSRKQDFERHYPGKQERQGIRDAAQVWRSRAHRIPTVPSLADSKTEMKRIDLS